MAKRINRLILGALLSVGFSFGTVLISVANTAQATETKNGISVSKTFSFQKRQVERVYFSQRFSGNRSTNWNIKGVKQLSVEKPEPVTYESYGYAVVETNLEIYNTQAGNRYIPGQCTWYAYNRRVEMGLPVGSYWGNGGSWQYTAAAGGRKVDNVPSVGAVIEWPGHVAIVEKVDTKNNRVYISEMNYLWNFNYHEAWIDNANQQVYIH